MTHKFINLVNKCLLNTYDGPLFQAIGIQQLTTTKDRSGGTGVAKGLDAFQDQQSEPANQYPLRDATVPGALH